MKRTIFLVAAVLLSAHTHGTPSHTVPANPQTPPNPVAHEPPGQVEGEAARVRRELTAPVKGRNKQHAVQLLKDYEESFKRGYDACMSSGLPVVNSKYCTNTAHHWW